LAADFDAAIVRNGGSPDPDLMYDRYFSKNGTFKVVAGYSSDTLENLMTRGVTETNPEVRKKIYAELQKELLEASPWVWVFRGYEYRVLQDNVEGFVSMADGSLRPLKQTRLR
jgi:peptide/nickel transport system substrate-binding protein